MRLTPDRTEVCSAEIGSPEIRPTEIRPAKNGPQTMMSNLASAACFLYSNRLSGTDIASGAW